MKALPLLLLLAQSSFASSPSLLWEPSPSQQVAEGVQAKFESLQRKGEGNLSACLVTTAYGFQRVVAEVKLLDPRRAPAGQLEQCEATVRRLAAEAKEFHGASLTTFELGKL